MRPVNLIPPEDRRGDHIELRTGIFTYVLVGGLAVLMLGFIAVAFTSKQVSDRESEKQSLESELEEVNAQAENLRAFADFRAIQETRTATVASLAQSRFDWERVIKELSLVLPPDVWLVNMTGTVNPAVQVQNGAEITIRDSVAGPALELVGCAPSEEATAGFIAALEDIDGVTRIGIQELNQPEDADAGSAATTGQEGTEDCRTRDFINQFQIVVAFDAVPTPDTASTAPSVPAPVAPPGDSGSQPAGNLNNQVDQAQNATNVIPGG